MAAIEAMAPVHLYLVGQPFMHGRTLGRLDIERLDLDQPGGQGLRLSLQPSPPSSNAPKDVRIVAVSATIESQVMPSRLYGRIGSEGDQALQFNQHPQSVRWTWILRAGDIEAIEADRASYAASAVGLVLRVQGTAVIDGETWGFAGQSSFLVPAAEWLALLAGLGYTTAPSVLALTGRALTADPSWVDAEKRLDEARRRLRLGEGAAALEAAFRAFEAISGKSYLETAWRQLLPEMPEQKAGSIARLFAGHAAYLNRVGRHLDIEPGESGDREPMPLDHWEAEAAVATSQMLLAYALRLKARAEE